MNHSRYRRLRAGANVGGGASNRASGGQPAEHRRHDVRHSLADQFHVRIVAVVAHAVGDHRRHQRLDRTQHRHGERRPEQSMNQPRMPARHYKVGKAAGDSAEARADSLHGQL